MQRKRVNQNFLYCLRFLKKRIIPAAITVAKPTEVVATTVVGKDSCCGSGDGVGASCMVKCIVLDTFVACSR